MVSKWADTISLALDAHRSVGAARESPCAIARRHDDRATAPRNEDGGVVLSASADGSPTLSYKWYRQADGVLVGTGATVYPGAISATTQYRLEVSNSCGGTPATAIVSAVVYTMIPAGTAAEMLPGTLNIRVRWPASPDAPRYRLERMSGGAWVTLVTTTATEYIDLAAAQSAYFYRVRAVDANNGNPSSPGNVDLITTVTLTPLGRGKKISAAHFEQIPSPRSMPCARPARSRRSPGRRSPAQACPHRRREACRTRPILWACARRWRRS